MDVKLPNGVIIKGVPEGTSKEAVKQKAISAGLAKPEDFGEVVSTTSDIPLYDDQGNPTEADIPQPKQPMSVGQNIVGAIEAVPAVVTGATTGALGYLQGVGTGLVDAISSGQFGTQQGVQNVADTAQRYAARGTYQPRSEAGQQIIGAIGEAASALPPTMAAFTPAQATGALQAAGRATQAAGIRAPLLPKPKIQQGAEEAVAFAERENLPIMTSDVSPPTSLVGRGSQIIGEQAPFVGTGGTRGVQQEARKGLLQKLKDETPEISDEVISKSLVDSVNAYKKEMGKQYDNVASKMGSNKISMNKTIDAIDKELFKLTKEGAVKDQSTIDELFKLRDDITSGEQDFRTARDNRTYMRENLKPKDGKSSTQADRVIERIYDAMTDDIQSSVGATLGKDAAKTLKQTDKLFASQINTQKKTKLKNALLKGDVKPEEATRVLFSTSPSDVKELYNALNDEGRANARAAIINRMLEKAGESPEKFLSEANRYKSQYNTFFQGEERAKLDGMIAYLNATQRAAKATVDTPTGLRNVPSFIAGGAAADLSGGGGAATITIGTIAGLSRLYESKPVRNALLKMARTKPSDPSYEKLYLQVDAALKSQAAAQQEDKK